MVENLYTYNAKVLRVIDGDTLKLSIDLGFGIFKTQTVRLIGLNAPELKGVEKDLGLESKKYLTILVLDKNITIRTTKDKTDKYGRILAEVFFNGSSINEFLITKGLAKTMK